MLGRTLQALACAAVLTAAQAVEQKTEIKKNWDKIAEKAKKNIDQVAPVMFRSLEAHWTDVPPVLDGSMDDECWKAAAVADDFYRIGSVHEGELKRPANQTEVRICYDASNLYIFYKMYDKEMDKLQKGRPQDSRDILDVHADQIELFLEPVLGTDRVGMERPVSRYFQLCVNPLGTTYDTRNYNDFSWNPEWKPATQTTNEFWTVEAKLPFAELNIPGEPTATPQTGDVWGALFARDQGTLHEWSRWTTSGALSNDGFHPVQNFGRLVFAGRRDGKPLPAVTASMRATLSFGKNALDFSINGKMDAGSFSISRSGKPFHQEPLKPDSQLRVAFELKDGGELDARLSLQADGREVYQYDLRKTLPMAATTLAAVQDGAGSLSMKLELMSFPESKRLLEACRSLGLEAAKLKADFDAGAVDEATLKAFAKLQQDWRAFSFDAALARLCPAKGAPPPFAAFAVDAYTKAFSRQMPSEGRLDAVELSAAGNERESFQIAVAPFWRELKGLKVAVSPLTGPDGAIASGNVSCFRILETEHNADYRKSLPGFDPDDPDSLRWWPDVLVPVENSLDIPAGQLTTLWFDALCPAGAKAGSYSGKVTLSCDGHEVVIPVKLDAQGFDIPKHPTLKNNHWLGYHWFYDYYKKRGDFKPPQPNDFDAFMAMFKRHLEVMERYRVATYPFGGMSWDWIAATREVDGRYTFDFTRLEKIANLARDHGANFFCSSFGCNPGGVSPVLGGVVPVVDKASGKTIPLKDCPGMKEILEKSKEYKSPFDMLYTTPFYKDYLPQLVDFMRRSGLLDYSYFEQFDESGPLTYIPAHRRLRELAPGLKLMNYGPHPLAIERKARGVGYADAWAPGLGKLDDPEALKTLKQRRVEYGEEYGFYVCGVMERPDGKDTPYIKLSQPSTAPRVIPWYAWKYRTDNFLVFMLFAGMPGKEFPEKPAVSGDVGYSPLLYPGPGGDLLPCVRLAALRDGMEDYECFKVLHGLNACLDDKFQPHQALLAKIEKALEVEPDICGNSVSWTRDAGKLRAKRQELAKLILEAKAAIAAYPESLLKGN